MKLVVTQFVNTALIYWFISLYHNSHIDSMMGENGLVNQVCSLIVTSGAIQLAVNYFNVNDIKRRLLKWYYYKKNNNEDRIYEFQ